jgi:hypothetical protein
LQACTREREGRNVFGKQREKKKIILHVGARERLAAAAAAKKMENLLNEHKKLLPSSFSRFFLPQM